LKLRILLSFAILKLLSIRWAWLFGACRPLLPGFMFCADRQQEYLNFLPLHPVELISSAALPESHQGFYSQAPVVRPTKDETASGTVESSRAAAAVPRKFEALSSRCSAGPVQVPIAHGIQYLAHYNGAFRRIWTFCRRAVRCHSMSVRTSRCLDTG
jgi:hypothetical protein